MNDNAKAFNELVLFLMSKHKCSKETAVEATQKVFEVLDTIFESEARAYGRGK